LQLAVDKADGVAAFRGGTAVMRPFAVALDNAVQPLADRTARLRPGARTAGGQRRAAGQGRASRQPHAQPAQPSRAWPMAMATAACVGSTTGTPTSRCRRSR